MIQMTWIVILRFRLISGNDFNSMPYLLGEHAPRFSVSTG